MACGGVALEVLGRGASEPNQGVMGWSANLGVYLVCRHFFRQLGPNCQHDSDAVSTMRDGCKAGFKLIMAVENRLSQ